MERMYVEPVGGTRDTMSVYYMLDELQRYLVVNTEEVTVVFKDRTTADIDTS